MSGLLREAIETAIIAIVVFLALQFSIQNFRVEGASMRPNFHEGQYLLVNKLVYLNWDPQIPRKILPFLKLGDRPTYVFQSPRRGEVIVFHFPRDRSRDFIKRVIAGPGDEVAIRHGTVYLNGENLEEPYVNDKGNDNMNPKIIPADSYFVLGDNRTRSDDSRDWGPVSRPDIIGKVWLTYWPSDRWGFIPGQSLESARQNGR